MLSGYKTLGTHKVEFEEASRGFYIPGTLFPSIPVFYGLLSREDGALSARVGKPDVPPTPCHYLKVRPDPQASQETKQCCLLKVEDVKPRGFAHSGSV